MVSDILSEIQSTVASVELVPSSGGRFEWSVDGDVVYSRKATGRYPELKELKQLVADRLP